jgi:hypothetical protein
VLQKEFGIGAHEALYVRETWEIDNLLEHRQRERQARAEAGEG